MILYGCDICINFKFLTRLTAFLVYNRHLFMQLTEAFLFDTFLIHLARFLTLIRMKTFFVAIL